jgi:hypothetical protein
VSAAVPIVSTVDTGRIDHERTIATWLAASNEDPLVRRMLAERGHYRADPSKLEVL